MAITFENAQAYFAPDNHHRAAVWAGFQETHCRGAIASARRGLARLLGRGMKENEAAYKEGDRIRDEFAVYEQALYLLETGVVANGSASDPVPIIAGNEEAQKAAGTKGRPSVVGPEALRWLGWGGVEIIRG
jgi:hypothetical protein